MFLKSAIVAVLIIFALYLGWLGYVAYGAGRYERDINQVTVDVYDWDPPNHRTCRIVTRIGLARLEVHCDNKER